MEVLMKSGAYLGEIRDIKAIYARQMLDDGRAVLPPDGAVLELQEPVGPSAPKKAAAKRAGNRS